jgi:8-oxo-dGTP pyrophosphatase MutT (NUDIX family)
VVVPLVPSAQGLTILLTRRTDEVEHHKGEICFPGGRVDPEDADHLAAALREAREEVGIFPEHLSVLGPLDDFVSTSGYRVRPFAAILNHRDYPFLAAPREVAEILLIPTDHLLDPANHEISPHAAGTAAHRFLWKQRVVWGMTASILDHFLRVALPRGVEE